MRAFLLILGLFVLATPLAAQARLSGPGRPVGERTTSPDDPSPVEERGTRAQQERELDRLRRRTGTPTAPGEQAFGPQRPPLFTDDGGFEVLVDTDAPEYLVGESIDDTETMFIRLRSAQDGFLTLLSGGVGRDFIILAPNDLIASFPIRGGESINFPLREWVQQGIELRPQLPDDVDVSQQTVIAVVTRRPVPLPLLDFNLADPRDGDRRIAVRTFQTWLARLPLTERGLGQTFYLVSRR